MLILLRVSNLTYFCYPKFSNKINLNIVSLHFIYKIEYILIYLNAPKGVYTTLTFLKQLIKEAIYILNNKIFKSFI